MSIAAMQAAISYAESGFSVIPIHVDGSKQPRGKWKHRQSERASVDEVQSQFAGDFPVGVGLVCGAVSNGLWAVDVDEPSIADREVAEILWRKVQEIDEEKRESIILHYYQGLSIRETAEVGRILTPLRSEFPNFIPIIVSASQLQGQKAMLTG